MLGPVLLLYTSLCRTWCQPGPIEFWRLNIYWVIRAEQYNLHEPHRPTKIVAAKKGKDRGKSDFISSCKDFLILTLQRIRYELFHLDSFSLAKNLINALKLSQSDLIQQSITKKYKYFKQANSIRNVQLIPSLKTGYRVQSPLEFEFQSGQKTKFQIWYIDPIAWLERFRAQKP